MALSEVVTAFRSGESSQTCAAICRCSVGGGGFLPALEEALIANPQAACGLKGGNGLGARMVQGESPSRPQIGRLSVFLGAMLLPWGWAKKPLCSPIKGLIGPVWSWLGLGRLAENRNLPPLHQDGSTQRISSDGATSSAYAIRVMLWSDKFRSPRSTELT